MFPGAFVHAYFLEGERLVFKFVHRLQSRQFMGLDQTLNQNATQIPDNHGVKFLIAKILSAETFRGLVFGTPEIFGFLTWSLLVLMGVDESLHFPGFSFLVENKMLWSYIFADETSVVEGVDGFEDLVKDDESLFFFEFIFFCVFVKGGFVGLGHQSNNFVIGNLFLYFEEIVQEEELIKLSEEGSVKIKGLGDLKFIYFCHLDHFDVKRFSFIVIGLTYWEIIGG